VRKAITGLHRRLHFSIHFWCDVVEDKAAPNGRRLGFSHLQLFFPSPDTSRPDVMFGRRWNRLLDKTMAVARWEFTERAKTRAFLISLLMMPLIMSIL